MLIGEYLHTIDQKNRISVPSKFRKDLGTRLVLTRGLDRCLFLYPLGEWKELAEKLAKLPWGKAENRSFVRTMIAGAADAEIDSLGRILIPDYLKVYAKLAEAAVVVGLYSRVEIWNPDLWANYSELSRDSVEAIAEKLGESGLY
ncbi:MAG: division/cell wall cluster transcriptional repressor MraZ [Candidatus Giovannonibacteria bacterium]|nr:MAG: division/cell wall cluster transcriptional repressor MraZ [Candidatus Giovannonibacteria bacterium]